MDVHEKHRSAKRAMSHVRVTYETTASPATCWALMADFAHIDAFNPHLERSAILEGSPAVCGLGTARQCDLKDGRGYLRERVVDWQEGRSYTVDIIESTLPVDGTQTTLGLEPLGDGTRLFVETRYQPRWGIAGSVLDVLLLRPTFASNLGGVIAGLAAMAEAREADTRVAA